MFGVQGGDGTYDYKDQEVEEDIGRSTTDEEVVDVVAVTFNILIETIPSVVNRMADCISLSTGSKRQHDMPLKYDREVDGDHVEQRDNSKAKY